MAKTKTAESLYYTEQESLGWGFETRDMRKAHHRENQRYLVFGGVVLALILVIGYFIVTFMVYPTVLPQQGIYVLPSIEPVMAGQKLMVFSPHPDDESVGVGGFIADSIQKGAEVRIVLVTDGNKHHNEAVRNAEFKEATAVLGVKESELFFMNFHDGTLYQQREPVLHQRMEEQIDAFEPDVLVYPCRQDFHPDHSTTARIIDGILERRQTKMRRLQYLVHYGWYYPRPKRLDPNLYLLPPARLIRFGNNWQKLLLPEAIEGLKQEAIYSYQSQLRDSVLTELLLSNIRKNELLIVR